MARTKELFADRARSAFAAFDGWTPRATQRVDLGAADVRTAESFIRRFDLPLRTPDALQLALAQRLGARLATFDEHMVKSALALGIPLVEL